MHGTVASVETIDVKELRNRVHPTRVTQVKIETIDPPEPEVPEEEIKAVIPEEEEIEEDGEFIETPEDEYAWTADEVAAAAVQAALRARVKGLTATATSSWNAEKRKKAASSGAAMKDGSYPIKDCADVGKAVKALGRGKGSHAAIKKHIKSRAKSLGCTSKLPDDWK